VDEELEIDYSFIIEKEKQTGAENQISDKIETAIELAKEKLAKKVMKFNQKHTDDSWPFHTVLPIAESKRQEIWQRWSYQTGALLAMALIFGIKDLHLDNWRISKLEPHLIDTEVWMSDEVTDIERTDATNSSAGGISPVASKNILFTDTDGVTIPSFNIAYYNSDKELRLEACKLNPHFFKQGFSDVLEQLHLLHADENSLLHTWLNNHFLEESFIRILLVNTQTLQNKQNEIYDIIQSKDLEEEINDFMKDIYDVIKVDTDFTEPQTIKDKYRALAKIQGTLSNYFNNPYFLPTNYLRPQRNIITDANNQLITTENVMPLTEKMKKAGITEPLLTAIKEIIASQPYLAQTPHSHLINKLILLKQNTDNYLQQIDEFIALRKEKFFAENLSATKEHNLSIKTSHKGEKKLKHFKLNLNVFFKSTKKEPEDKIESIKQSSDDSAINPTVEKKH
ncbi:MAG: hypothetical protein ACK4PR_07720, partial [Gammaproteobacteria bacterium]